MQTRNTHTAWNIFTKISHSKLQLESWMQSWVMCVKGNNYCVSINNISLHIRKYMQFVDMLENSNNRVGTFILRIARVLYYWTGIARTTPKKVEKKVSKSNINKKKAI